MKYLIILFVTLFIFSCNQGIKQRKIFVNFSNDNNWTSTIFFCDSVHMESQSKAILFVDGSKTTIYAKSILVGSTNSF